MPWMWAITTEEHTGWWITIKVLWQGEKYLWIYMYVNINWMFFWAAGPIGSMNTWSLNDSFETKAVSINYCRCYGPHNVLEGWSNIYVHHEAPLEQSKFFRWLWWSSAIFLTMALLEQYNLFEHWLCKSSAIFSTLAPLEQCIFLEWHHLNSTILLTLALLAECNFFEEFKLFSHSLHWSSIYIFQIALPEQCNYCTNVTAGAVQSFKHCALPE